MLALSNLFYSSFYFYICGCCHCLQDMEANTCFFLCLHYSIEVVLKNKRNICIPTNKCEGLEHVHTKLGPLACAASGNSVLSFSLSFQTAQIFFWSLTVVNRALIIDSYKPSKSIFTCSSMNFLWCAEPLDGFLLYTIHDLAVLQLYLYLLRLWDSKLNKTARGSTCPCCHLFAALELCIFSCNFCFLFIPFFSGSENSKAIIFPSQSCKNMLHLGVSLEYLYGYCALRAMRSVFLYQITWQMACSG